MVYHLVYHITKGLYFILAPFHSTPGSACFTSSRDQTRAWPGEASAGPFADGKSFLISVPPWNLLFNNISCGWSVLKSWGLIANLASTIPHMDPQKWTDRMWNHFFWGVFDLRWMRFVAALAQVPSRPPCESKPDIMVGNRLETTLPWSNQPPNGWVYKFVL